MGEALIMTDDNGRMLVGEEVVFDAMDGMGEAEDDESVCAG